MESEKNKDGKYLVHIGKNVKLINSSTGNFTNGDRVNIDFDPAAAHLLGE